MNHDQIRIDQNNEASRKDSTLRVKPGFTRKPTTTKKPFVAKGHDAILKSIQDDGADIEVNMISDGTSITGKLLARDRYTITVLDKHGVCRTLYKHAIESFAPVAKKVQ